MPDKDKMSVEEILAACRRMDGGGSAKSSGDQPTEGDASAQSQGASSAGATEAPATPPPAGPKKKPSEMSVEEILAAARAEKRGGAAAPQESAESSEAASESAQPAAPAAPAKKPSEMSVAEILAAARAEKAKSQASKPAAAAKPKVAPAAKPKPKPKPAAKPASTTSGPLDTASILAAARKPTKRGPVSKEEAARAGKETPAARTAPKVPPMPQKPEFLKPAAKKRESAETRRGFFASLTGIAFGSAMAVGFVSLAVTHLLWVLGFARYMFPNILIEPPSKFKVGFPDVIGPGQVVTKFKARFGVWIVRNEYEGVDQIYALRSVCTHLGCTPNWLEAEQKFKCPCHGSGFYKSGINFEGPAPRPLERYAIRIADDGQLEVDKSRKFQQELGQWSDPQSYVPV